MYNQICDDSVLHLGEIVTSLNSIISKLITTETLVAIPTLIFAISIPLSIFIVENSTTYPWDIKVVMVKVLGARRLLISLITYIFILILWQIANLRILLLIIATLCIFILVKVIIEGYKWLTVLEYKGVQSTTYRSMKRLEYLGDLNHEEFSTTISTTWQDNNNQPGTLDNRAIVQLYTKRLEIILQQQDIDNNTHVLDAFINNIDKVNLEDQRIHRSILSSVIPYLFSLGSVNVTKHWKVEELYNAIIRQDIKTKSGAYLFFHDLINWTDEQSIDESEVANETLEILLRELNETNLDFIWRNFPEKWKITYENLVDGSTSKITYSVLNRYIYWLAHRTLLFDSYEKDYDSIADRVTRELIPKVDVILWTDLTAFFYASSGFGEGETSEYGMVKGFITRRKSFGNMGRVPVSFSDNSTTIEQEERDGVDEVVNIINRTKLFPGLEDKLYIRKLLEELDNVIERESIKEGTVEYSRYKRLKYVLELIEKVHDIDLVE